jgi:hypothetical protein
MRRLLSIAAAAAAVALSLGALTSVARAAAFEMVGPYNFSASPFTVGSIAGQAGWTFAGPGNVDVIGTHNLGGSRALQISNAYTDGAFGDWAFSPSLATPATAYDGLDHVTASFELGAVSSGKQPGLHAEVSPDINGGARMSFLQFMDTGNGRITVYFSDVTDRTQQIGADTFSYIPIASLTKAAPHWVTMTMDLKPGYKTDVVDVYIDGRLVHRGTSWKNYYLFDNESGPAPNPVPGVANLIFQARDGYGSVPTYSDHGFLFDHVVLLAS